MTISIYSFLLLTFVLSTDTFMAGLSYSSSHVKVPPLSMILISVTSGLMYTLSLMAGSLISLLLPGNIINYFSFFVLFLLALYKLYDTFPSHSTQKKDFTTDAISEKVNTRNIHVLSPGEALLLSFLLSVDSISAGISAGLPALDPAVIFLFTAVIHFCAISLGLLSGKILTRKSSHNFAWLSAAILFLLAFLRLF